MKTWKTKKTVCRGTKSGKFANKGKCGAFKRQRVRAGTLGKLFLTLAFLLLPFTFMAQAASGGSFVGGAQYIPVLRGSGTSNRFTAPTIVGPLVISNNLAGANNRRWWIGGVTNGGLQFWLQNDDGTFIENALTLHRTNVYFEFIEPVDFTRAVTNSTLTASALMATDANKKEVSVTIGSGLDFTGGTLSAIGGGATNAQPPSAILTNLSGLPSTNVIAFVSQLNSASNALLAATQPTNANLTALAGGTLGANSATVTNKSAVGVTNTALAGATLVIDFNGRGVVKHFAAGNFTLALTNAPTDPNLAVPVTLVLYGTNADVTMTVQASMTNRQGAAHTSTITISNHTVTTLPLLALGDTNAATTHTNVIWSYAPPVP